MAEMPAPPADPFANAGAETNIDRQKNLLNDIIASEGQYGRQIYEQQGPRAQAMLQQTLAAAPQVGPARKAVYDAFMLDATRAQQQHTDTMQRQAQLNQAFMDQAKAAVPIHQQSVQQYSDALRQRLEHEQEMQRQQIAAQRAASRSSSRSTSVDARVAAGKEDMEVARRLLEESGVPRENWSPKDLQKAGIVGQRGSPVEIAKSLGIAVRGDDANNYAASVGGSRGWTKQDATAIQQMFDVMWEEDVPWSQAYREIETLYKGDKNAANLLRVYAQANRSRWGV